MNRIIKNFYQSYKEQRSTRAYELLYKRILSQNPHYKNVLTVSGEKEWLKRWQPLLKHHKLSPLSYRIFSHIAGESIDRLPLEVCVNAVEPTLNSKKYVDYYDDKNSLPHIMLSDWLPITYIRSIRGHLFYNDGSVVNDGTKAINSISSERIIVKPSCGESGRGVTIFSRGDNGYFYNNCGELLNLDSLRKQWGTDWLIQECIRQSDELAVFNLSSVNTLRVATYRSLDGCIFPIGHILRVGSKDAEVDNAHAGGMFCGIDANGKVGKYFCDFLARTNTTFNGIDLSKSEYIISNMDGILRFVCNAASCIQHHDLVAFDIAITKDGIPKIIEINIGGFSAWLFEMTQKSTFGCFTEEVIQRCMMKRQ